MEVDVNEAKMMVYILLAVNLYVFYTTLTRRRSAPQEIAALAFAVLLVKVSAPPLYHSIGNLSLTLFLTGILFCLPVFYIFKEHWAMKLFVFFITYALGQYIVLIVSFVPAFMHHYFNANTPSIFIYALTAGLEIALLLFMYKSIVTPLQYILKTFHQENFAMSLLPFSACLILAAIYNKGVFDMYTLVIAISITFIFIVAFYSLNLTIRLKDRKNNMENQLSLQIHHYRNLTQHIQKTRIYRHDMRHHLAGITQLLSKRDIAATQAYLARLREQYLESQTLVFCENKCVDAVLAHYAKIARQKSIPVTIRLDVPEDIGAASLDLCVIIGSCFETAIAACGAIQKAEQRRISIHGYVTCSGAAIALQNSYNRKRFGPLKQPDRQGCGLESARLLAQKYNGTIQTCARDAMLITEISLNAPNEP